LVVGSTAGVAGGGVVVDVVGAGGGGGEWVGGFVCVGFVWLGLGVGVGCDAPAPELALDEWFPRVP
jgi:hypothetical protein